MAEVSCLLSYPRARAFYFAERVVPQLTTDLELCARVPYDPPAFSLVPYQMGELDLDEWRGGIHYISRLLSLEHDYATFARERLMPRFIGHQVSILFHSCHCFAFHKLAPVIALFSYPGS